ncbi:putative 4-hydroxy-4-methyl-2-oxoglutarate aldolase 3 [Camellia lanceoleosa]|uniref:4-hydroxy-4-methyl-2-oxoglutarate aldolase 3 n=1 Tax=Camellia lanceoleosa TaxID=1840588 RepID=A0ACC0HHK8_9ERIC|nr:putative 4-hydroxy-4-methyl-2-oxoglutarate aldolase 3 [Camellia lanceoleosa]
MYGRSTYGKLTSSSSRFTLSQLQRTHGFPRLVTQGEYVASLVTAEACDSNAGLLLSGDLRCLQPIFQIYGQRRAFSGPIVTLKVFEHNVSARELLETKGKGRVLVIDGGGSKRCALLGGNLAQLAQNMGWAGIVINGCIRDVEEIKNCDIGVRALASHPQKPNKKGVTEKHLTVHFAGTLLCDGEWLYADSDTILVSRTELSV